MKLVLPVSHVDLDMAALLAKRIVTLGGMENEHVVVISTMRAAWDIEPILATLRPGFRETTLHVLPDECEEGWPESANHLFYGGATFLEELYEEFYWMEGDTFPIRSDWWDKWKKEYITGGKPYMGCVNTSRFYDRVTGKEIEDGQHLVGTGVYPARFLETCRSVHHLSRIPFDVYMGPEIAPQTHHTELLHHAWGTCRYRFEGHILTCDDTKHEWHKYSGPVNPKAAIIHGAKDLTLYSLFPDGSSW